MQFQGFVFGETYSRDACASYLADHLDDALGLIDRIAACKLGPNQQTITDDVEHDGEWIIGGDAIVSRFAEIRTYVHDLKTLELALTTKISQARVWAERVQRYDPRLDRVAGLMLSGTHAFVDAGSRQADTTTDDFNTCDPALAYLRSRGLVGEDVYSLDQVGPLTSGYMFQVWGGVTLFDIAEMMNTFLGAADVHYSLYVPDEDTVAEVEAVADHTDGSDETDVDESGIAEASAETDDGDETNRDDGDLDDDEIECAADVEDETAPDDGEADDVVTQASSDEAIDADLEAATETDVDENSDGAKSSLAEPVHVMGAIKSAKASETAEAT